MSEKIKKGPLSEILQDPRKSREGQISITARFAGRDYILVGNNIAVEADSMGPVVKKTPVLPKLRN